MDADTRHQLKTNELAEALSKLQNLRDPRLLYGLAVLGVVLVIVLAYVAWSYNQRRASERGWNRLDEISAALAAEDAAEVLKAESDLRGFIDDAPDVGLAGYARLRLAHSRFRHAMMNPEQREAAFTEAKQLLEQVRANAAETPLLDSAATFLLASTYESLGQAEDARGLYEQMKSEPRYAGPYRELADARLENMEPLRLATSEFQAGEPPAGAQATTVRPNLPEGLDPELIRQFQESMQARPADPAMLPVARPDQAASLPPGVTPAEPAPAPAPPPSPAEQSQTEAQPAGEQKPSEPPPTTPPGGNTAR